MNYQKKTNFNPCSLWIYVAIVCLEVLPTGAGDVHRVSKDSVPAGETGSSSACLPQELLPLCSLQRKAQVCRIFPEFSKIFLVSFDVSSNCTLNLLYR